MFAPGAKIYNCFMLVFERMRKNDGVVKFSIQPGKSRWNRALRTTRKFEPDGE